MAELTRKAFHDLAVECRDLAQELARHEQDQVDVILCRRFNEWLPRLLAYDPLRSALPTLTPARPLTRNMLFAAVTLTSVILALVFREPLGRLFLFAIVSAVTLTAITLFLVPVRLYGTTVALIEGKVLRVVNVLEAMLMAGEMGFTEAAFFVVKENLTTARSELRQQIHLAQRW